MVAVDGWWYDSVFCSRWWSGGVGVGWPGVVAESVVGVEGWEGRRSPALGVNGGWMGAVGMGSLARVGVVVVSAGGV